MNKITYLLVLLLLVSFILPATAIKYVQAYPNMCEGGSCDPATPPPIMPKHGGATDNTTSDGGHNNTSNLQQESNNTGSIQ